MTETAQSFQRRKEFLSLNAQDEKALQNLHDALDGEAHGFVDGFYHHLLSFPEMRALIPDDAALAQWTPAGFGSALEAAHDVEPPLPEPVAWIEPEAEPEAVAAVEELTEEEIAAAKRSEAAKKAAATRAANKAAEEAAAAEGLKEFEE